MEADYHASRRAGRAQSSMWTAPEREAWKAEGACVGTEVNFFTERGEDTAALRLICAECDVREVCKEYAIRNNEVGFWGGTSERQRRQIRKFRAKPVKVIVHGRKGYQTDGCRCEVCKSANAGIARAWRAEQRALKAGA